MGDTDYARPTVTTASGRFKREVEHALRQQGLTVSTLPREGAEIAFRLVALPGTPASKVAASFVVTANARNKTTIRGLTVQALANQDTNTESFCCVFALRD